MNTTPMAPGDRLTLPRHQVVALDCYLADLGPVADLKGGLAEALQVMLAEPGRPCIGKVIDDFSLDYNRATARAFVLLAALLR